MKNQAVVQHQMGFNAVFDQISKINLSLPENFRIYMRSDKVWMGGNDNGSVYLHMERISAKALELTKPLADGDLDIEVFPQGRGEELDQGVVAQDVNCRLRGEDLSGLWLRVSFDDQYHYLVMLAGRESAPYSSMKDAGLEIARTIRDQALKSVNSRVEAAA